MYTLSASRPGPVTFGIRWISWLQALVMRLTLDVQLLEQLRDEPAFLGQQRVEQVLLIDLHILIPDDKLLRLAHGLQRFLRDIFQRSWNCLPESLQYRSLTFFDYYIRFFRLVNRFLEKISEFLKFNIKSIPFCCAKAEKRLYSDINSLIYRL